MVEEKHSYKHVINNVKQTKLMHRNKMSTHIHKRKKKLEKNRFFFFKKNVLFTNWKKFVWQSSKLPLFDITGGFIILAVQSTELLTQLQINYIEYSLNGWMNDDDDGGGGIVTDFAHRRSPIWNDLTCTFLFSSNFSYNFFFVFLSFCCCFFLFLLFPPSPISLSRAFHVITSLYVCVRACAKSKLNCIVLNTYTYKYNTS